MYRLIDRVLRRTVKHGDLTIRDPDGRPHRYGDGTGHPVVARITSRRWLGRLLRDPDLYLGEAYMHGALIIEEGDAQDLLELLVGNLRAGRMPAPVRLATGLRRLTRRLWQMNTRTRARRNVEHHYDVDRRFYRLFLDPDLQYSCAYFERDDMELAEAQLAKKRHLAAKLAIEPGMRVLDIGCGFGGMALYLAEMTGAEVLGVTLSREQFEVATARAERAGLAGKVRFEMTDYRDIKGTFDRIVSVGMFEHVGVGYYPAFFDKVRDLLKPDGVAVLHSINRADGPGVTSRFITRHIFPGGYIPAMSEVLPAIERAGLTVSDVEILRLHYAKTLRHWRQRFATNREQAQALTDEVFVRKWEFYLASAETAFRVGEMNNFQIQMLRDQAALPLTRDYIREAEERLRARERDSRHLKSVRTGR